ncbi:Na/Pi cotransporter family protein [Nocardioides limicola]|uniref:Na/Pi cotransporter family protein n=1 Tax=Nocardioides limicola TaxID=2803368 RepID=UPI00193C4E01|nr:Na/Pi symporter [Nocardioides sp. DJM-14]
MPLSSIAELAGGLGLFLLGMLMLTDGLRLAAGGVLRDILRRFTRTPLRGLGSGALVTAAVQSSSAVTVMLIGFINAGLLTFSQSLWVIFGANLGTSMTGWLVAIVGFKLQIETFALPLVALGMVLRLSGARTRRGGLGTAIAGFGVLFVGLSLLQGGFAETATRVTLPTGGGLLTVGWLLLIGFGLTVAMQSSSAALAIALTAAHTGVVDVQGAAVVVIGVNVGTTATAVLASIGATSNAKRTAGAHIGFNLVTGAAALLLLPVLLPALLRLQDGVFADDSPAVSLALFHTAFNLLGVLLMVPLAGAMGRFLERRFTRGEEQPTRPQHLDDTVAEVPELAVAALVREVSAVGAATIDAACSALHGRLSATEAARLGQQVTDIGTGVNDFVVRMNREGLAEDTSVQLASVLRAKRSYETIALQIDDLVPWPAGLSEAEPYVGAAVTLLRSTHPEAADEGDPASPTLAHTDVLYRELRARLLVDGARGAVDVAEMERMLNVASSTRRILKKATEAALLLSAPGTVLGPEGEEPATAMVAE